MTAKLSDVLQKVATKYAEEADKSKAMIHEWQEAIERLFAQLRTWLSQADTQAVLTIEEAPWPVNEPNVGRYQVTRLDIRLYERFVTAVIPKARKTIKQVDSPNGRAIRATGRVDLSDEQRRYVLYRFASEHGHDEWFIDHLSPKGELLPLTQESFEAAVVSYLQ